MSRQDHYLQEVTKPLLKLERKDDETYKAFRKNVTNLNVLGLRVPVIKGVEKLGFSFYHKPEKLILKTWDFIWKQSDIHEVMSLPLFYYRRHKQKLDVTHWKTMKQWINRVENWEHADALCQLYSIMYERHTKLIEPTLRTWNTSNNSWKRRASIVSTIYYASKNRKPPSRKVVLSLIEPLLLDKDPYVQKAVGWQLREAYNLWPTDVLKFIDIHISNLSPISFSYATEKLDKKTKTVLKAKRKRTR